MVVKIYFFNGLVKIGIFLFMCKKGFRIDYVILVVKVGV